MQDHKDIIKREFSKQAEKWEHNEKTQELTFTNNVDWILSELNGICTPNINVSLILCKF